MLGHSLGALTALKLGEEHGDLVERLVPEEPPGYESSDFDEVAHGGRGRRPRQEKDPEELKREQLEENPSWSEEYPANHVVSLKRCDAEPVAALICDPRFDLAGLVRPLEVPTLLILGSETQGSALPDPERATVANTLPHGKVKVFDTGHSVHSEDSESYLRLLGTWLESPGRYRSAG